MKDCSKSIKILSISVTILYILFLVWSLFFKFGDIAEVRWLAEVKSKMTDWERFTFDIIPFDFSNTNQKALHFLINILNFFVFIPLGVGLIYVDGKVNYKKHLLICFIVSLIIEVTQYFTFIGGFATDDLLMNTLGYFGAVLIYKLIFKRFSSKANFYLMIFCNILMLVVVTYAVINIAPIFDDYIQVIKDYAFK